MKNLLYTLVLLLIGCNGSAPTKPTENGEDSTLKQSSSGDIRIALLPTLDLLPYYYAQAEGLLDSVQPHIEFVSYYAAMDADTALLRGRVHCSVCDPVKLDLWKKNGDSLSILNQSELRLFLMTSQTSRLRSLASLKERVIAITRLSVIDQMADSLLSAAKLAPEQLNRPQINNMWLRCQMVNQNQFDGAIMPEPYASWCEAEGAYRLAGSTEAHIPQAGCLIVCHDSTLRKHPTLPGILSSAYNNAAKHINSIIRSNDSLLHLIRTDTVMTESVRQKTLDQYQSLLKYFPKEAKIEVEDTIIKWTPYDVK